MYRMLYMLYIARSPVRRNWPSSSDCALFRLVRNRQTAFVRFRKNYISAYAFWVRHILSPDTSEAWSPIRRNWPSSSDWLKLFFKFTPTTLISLNNEWIYLQQSKITPTVLFFDSIKVISFFRVVRIVCDKYSRHDTSVFSLNRNYPAVSHNLRNMDISAEIVS